MTMGTGLMHRPNDDERINSSDTPASHLALGSKWITLFTSSFDDVGLYYSGWAVDFVMPGWQYIGDRLISSVFCTCHKHTPRSTPK